MAKRGRPRLHSHCVCCGGKHYAKELCRRCYDAERAAARRNNPKPQEPNCACGRKIHANGKCRRCYDAERAAARRNNPKPQEPNCACGRKIHAKNKCQRCYDAERASRGERPRKERLGFRWATVDGETFVGPYGRDEYALLQIMLASGGVLSYYAEKGCLSTEECLDALFTCKYRLLVGYGLNFDINHWLRDVPPKYLRTLFDFKRVVWGGYEITWIPGRQLCIRREDGEERIIADLLAFFGRSMVEALLSFGLDVPPIIPEGKARRGSFTRDQYEWVSEYNRAELKALHGLASALDASVAQIGVRFPSYRWTGGGGLARLIADDPRHTGGITYASYTTPDIRRHLLDARSRLAKQPDLDATVDPWIAVERAYFGGRVESSIIGHSEKAYEYDIISAYPRAMAQGLPCMGCGGEWRSVCFGDDWPWAIYCVKWQHRQGDKSLYGPFPVRHSGGLAWPTSGAAWVHQEELMAALATMTDEYEIMPLVGWVWVPACSHDAGGWVSDLLERRIAARREGKEGVAIVYKIALNSLYGIACDRAGYELPEYHPDIHDGYKARPPRIPRHHNRYYAGLITARTRAMLLRAMAEAKKAGADVLALHTDNIVTDRPIPLDPGVFEAGRSGEAMWLVGGIYRIGGKCRTRGVPRGALPDTDDVWARAYATGYLDVTAREFVSLRHAYHQLRWGEDWDKERLVFRSVTKRMHLTLWPRRSPGERGEKCQRWYAPDLRAYYEARERDIVSGVVQRVREEEEEAAYGDNDW